MIEGFEKLTKQNKILIIAFERGYRMTSGGELLTPKGKIIKGSIKETKRTKYKKKRHNIRIYPHNNSEQINLYFHKFQAYCKYGIEMFKDGLVVRHLNGNSLDNSLDNIELGTCQDNSNDIPFVKKRLMTLNAIQRNRKISYEDSKNIKNEYLNGISVKTLSEKYNVTTCCIYKHLNDKIRPESYYTQL